MAGLFLGSNAGITASAVPNMFNGYGGAAVPAASTVPEGPSTITQQAFGVPGVGPGGKKGLTIAGLGTFALVALAFIWWSLPR
jgi:hypothetical protein